MFLPLGTDRPLQRPTRVNHAVILVTSVFFVIQSLLAARNGGNGAQAPSTLELTLILDPRHLSRWWTLATYALLHGSLLHLAGNMLFLWVFGPNVEDRFGRVGYLLFYIGGAVVAGGLHSVFDNTPVLGASGAIAAVTGAYLVLFPRTVIKTLLFLGLVGIPAVWFIGFQIAWDMLQTGLGRAGNVATIAHLGGYGFGIGLSLVLLWTGVLQREVYDLFTILRQARRRRGLRLAHVDAERERERALKRAESEPSSRLMAERAEVARFVSEHKLAEAASAYRRLLDRHADTPEAVLLSRKHQYDLANHFFATEDYQSAADAYERLLRGYPRDPEAPEITLLLGTINARYLNDPIRAKELLNRAAATLTDGEKKAMALRELEALG